MGNGLPGKPIRGLHYAPDATAPAAGVAEASDGTIWGTGLGGGANAGGAVFKLTLSPAPAAPVQLTASASTIALGDSLTLNWS